MKDILKQRYKIATRSFANLTYGDEARAIYDSISVHLSELSRKYRTGKYNEATEFAYQIAMLEDIEKCLNKLRRK